MSSITSGVGLISGLPVNDLVDSLLAPQRAPITLLQTRLGDLSRQRNSFLQISANLLSILNSASRFKDAKYFQGATAKTSDDKAVLATASPGAALGQIQITVKNLAAANQVISTGFATLDSTPVGAGTFTIETAQAFVNRSTRLADLRGGEGVQHGKFRITDRAGGSTVVDLASAVTLDDVVKAVNNQTAANVTARVEGDHLILADGTGLATGSLVVAEVGLGNSATQLGILASSATGSITGQNLVAISSTTRLDDLNDGNGIRRRQGAPDFSVSLADGTNLDISISERIQLDTPLAQLNGGAGVPTGSIHVEIRSGAEADIDLSTAVTLGDVKTKIEAAGLGLTVSLGASSLSIHDASTAPTGSTDTHTFTISEVGSGTTAKALGVLGAPATGDIVGKKIYFVESVGDVVRLINGNPGNGGKLNAAISADGLGLTLTDTTSGAGTFQVTALNDSKAAEDLGLLVPSSGGVITTRRLLAGLNSVLLRSLRGGSGAQTGVIQLTDRAGVSANVDLTSAQSLSQVIEAINSAGTGLRAAVSANGLGVTVTDTSGGSGNLAISDVSGTLAADLGITANQAGPTVTGGNLQRQYTSSNTLLKSLRGGAGVPPGKFKITDSTGASAVVDLTQGNEERIQDVLDEINSRGLQVIASINANGDGILLTDTGGGAGKLKVAEEGGSTAKALGILGEAATGQTTLDGSFEYKITLSGGDTLQDVLAKIKATGAPVTATVLRDGATGKPFRLSLTSNQSGIDGELAVDSGATGISFSDLVQARDASVIFGPADADVPLVFNGATNTLTDAVPNVRLDLVGISSQPATITITQDAAGIAKDLTLFVSALNSALSAISDLTHFDDKTNTRSVLTGDPTVRAIRDRITNLLNKAVPGLQAPINRLGAIGIELVGGNSVRLDEAKFNEVFQANPDAVQALFSSKDVGLGFEIEKEIKRYTETGNGVLALKDDNIQKSQDILNQRITQIQALVDSRRQRLLAQFSATEQIISRLQGQQASLASLSSIASGFGN